jgi:hypothetical protein
MAYDQTGETELGASEEAQQEQWHADGEHAPGTEAG